jgi:alpha-beta hydrolase superfamily lysophospholipase
VPPGDAPPSAAVLFLHGSGPQDRDENSPSLALHVFDALAADLAAAGLASLRYDKRGVGESPGDLLRATVHDLAADARAAVRFLRRVHETAGLPVFLVGHDEGAIIALLLGADDPPPAGLVLLCPHITPMPDVLRLQAAGVQAAIERLPPEERRRLGIPDGFDQRAVTEQMIRAIREAPPDQATLAMGQQTVPLRWFRSHFDLDTAAIVAAVRAPVLAIGAAKDAQVPPQDAVAIAARLREAAAARGAEADATALVVPDLTHVLRRSPGSGLAGEYAHLCQEPVDAEVRRMVTEWIAARVPTGEPGAAGPG